jgi:hypothetical protein
MAQVSEQAVKQALSQLGEAGDGQPLLRPEQVDAITAIGRESDPAKKAQMATTIMSRLLEEAAASQRKLEQLCSQNGIKGENVKSFLGGERVAGDARREVDAATGQFESEITRELDSQAQQAIGGGARASGGMPRPRAGRIPV